MEIAMAITEPYESGGAAKPSRTAYKVALNVIALGSKPGMDQILPPAIVSATEMLLIKSGIIGDKTAAFARSKWAISIYEAFDWLLPGQFEAFAHRKAFCENQVQEGIRAGAKQILVLGAGYDTLGWRLAPLFPGVGFFEIDHPATARLKAKGIEAMDRPDNLHLIAEDLGENQLSDILEQKDIWALDGKTVIIAEGLVMYLRPESVRNMFEQCACVTGQGSRIVFSYIPMGKDSRPDVGRCTGLMLWLQKVAGEPWQWSIHPEDLALFLSETGWPENVDQQKPACKHGVEYFAVGIK
jgi:methyltransferase (TIGR00027 family)